MHPVVLIPLATAFGAAALAAAIAAREPGQRANRLVAAVLVCDVWWAFFEVLCLTAPDAGAALRFARLGTVGSILLSPVALHLLMVVVPEPMLPHRRLLTAQYAIAAAIVLASVGGPWFVPGVVHLDWGFVPRNGPLVPVAYVSLLLVPMIALLRVLQLRTLARMTRSRGSPWVEIAIGVNVLVASVTDLLLPSLGKPFPRLGSASAAVWGLVTWWKVYRFRAAGLSPRQFASEILATLPDGVALVRLDGRIRGLNAKLAQLAKRDESELLGRPVGELVEEPAEAAGGAERESELKSASGARVPVSLSDAWLRDDSGFAIGRVLVVRDLEELVSLRSRLLTSARLAAVGQLAAGIAHEINNPIAYVRSNVGLLERHWKDLDVVFESRTPAPGTRAALARSRELLREAADGIDRIASIVRDVGGFSWKGGAENEPADPVELLETALRVAGPQLRRKASVERSFARLPLVPCRPQELMQVFLNLVLASVNTIEEHGQLGLSAGVDGAFAWVEIAVDGAGLAPEDLERIFDPFSPTQGSVAQAGLGLAISRQIVERQGGRIQVESQPGRGMRFRVHLPVTAAPPEGGRVMHPFAILQLLAGLAAVMLAVALVVINSQQRANRLIALVLLCSAHWSLCEVFWSLSDDPRSVLQWIRLSSLGWMWLGPLALHVTSELVGGANTGLRRALPWAYSAAIASTLLYIATPWCLADPVRTSFGWGVRFGPLFPLVYLPTILSTSLVVAQWPSLFPRAVSPGERREARWLLAGILVPLAVASTTDALLPWLEIDVPRLGSMSLLALGAIVAGSVRRHGYFLLAPGAFARPILETLRDGVALLHPDGRIRTCNQAFARLVGAGSAGLAGASVYDWLPGLARDPALESRGTELELRPQGAPPMPVSVSASPLRDEQRDVIGRVLAVRDLREVAALRSRLITSGRLAAVGELAAGIAQEIEEPVTAVRAHLVELREVWRTLAVGVDARDEQVAPVLIEGADLIEESGEGVERVATIVKEVSAFSQAGLGEPQLVSVNDLLENAVNVAALSFSVVVERCYAELPPVRCDAQQLRQVFLNLLLNALQAVGDFGVIRLVTEAQGDSVRIRVEDDGCGIPEDQIERIFDPFYTTRRTGTAAGLGLAHCYQIIRHHGGEITVSSKVGVGSTFSIRLPV